MTLKTDWNIGPCSPENRRLGQECKPRKGVGGVEAAGPDAIHPPINCGITKGPFIYEDELPEDISQEDYDSWYERSFVDFVRIGPSLT